MLKHEVEKQELSKQLILVLANAQTLKSYLAHLNHFYQDILDVIDQLEAIGDDKQQLAALYNNPEFKLLKRVRIAMHRLEGDSDILFWGGALKNCQNASQLILETISDYQDPAFIKLTKKQEQKIRERVIAPLYQSYEDLCFLLCAIANVYVLKDFVSSLRKMQHFFEMIMNVPVLDVSDEKEQSEVESRVSKKNKNKNEQLIPNGFLQPQVQTTYGENNNMFISSEAINYYSEEGY